MGEAKIPPVTVSFFVVFPTVALCCGVAVVASPEPRSWPFFAAVVVTWLGLRGSSWFIYKNRDDVQKVEKIVNVMENETHVDSNDDEEGKADEPVNEQPQETIYHYSHLYKILQGIMRPSLFTTQVQHASVISLAIVLTVRIFSIELFQTHPANVDFGGSSNIAFKQEFDSFFNVVFGSISSFFSYPAVAGLVARVFTTAAGDSLLLKKPNVYILWLCETLSACMSIFPSTYIIGGIAKETRSFSNSNHLRKVAEWLTGYALGATFGMYFSCIVQRIILLISGILGALENIHMNADEMILLVETKLAIGAKSDVDTDKDSDTQEVVYGFGKPDEYKGQAVRGIELGARLLTRTAQILFAVTTILDAVFLGSTWFYDREEMVSPSIICILLAAVGFVFGTISFATNRAY
jgi:hypothetical protein